MSWTRQDMLNALTTAEIVIILLEDPGWTLPAGTDQPRERMAAAWAAIGQVSDSDDKHSERMAGLRSEAMADRGTEAA